MGMTPASTEELNGKDARPKVRIDKLLRDTSTTTSPRFDSSSTTGK